MRDVWPSRTHINRALEDIENHLDDFDEGERAMLIALLHRILCRLRYVPLNAEPRRTENPNEPAL